MSLRCKEYEENDMAPVDDALMINDNRTIGGHRTPCIFLTTA